VAGEIGEEAAADLHDRSGGNPFFATELARVAAAAADGAVPPGVRDVVDRRLGRLPVVVRPVLHLAATAGQRFDVALLQRAAPDDVDTLLDALDAAEAAELVRPSGPGWMAFAHALVRDSLLAELSQLRRSRLHARLAAALPDTADVFERAHHLVSGRPFTDGRETVAACAAAARRAVADHAHDNAARWWERALAALDADAAGGLRQELLLQAGESMARAGSWAAGQQLLTAAIGTALDTGDLDSAATAAEQFSHIGGIWHPVAYGDYPAPLVDRLEALVRATGSGSGPAHVRALAALASVVQYGADRGRGVRESARAVSAARRVGHPGLLLEALAARVVATWLPGHEADMIEAADELLALRPPPEAEIVALARRAAARLTLGDVAGHALDLDRAEELAQEHELPLVQSQLLSMQAARANLHGDFEVALALIDRAEALAQRTQLYGQSMQHLAMRSFVWIDQGCLPERLAAAWPREPVPDPVGSQPLLRALALLQAGRTRAAAEVVGRALEPFPEQWDWVSLTSWQAEVAADLAAAPDVHLDASVPAAIADRLLPYESQFAVQGGIGALGPVAISLARAEAAAGRVDDAERHLREGVDVAQAHELRPALARGHLALAELLAGRGRRAESAAEAVAARDVAETIGMRHAAVRAARLAHE
jgi:tetratricopeptide (TPR) repeat protein